MASRTVILTEGECADRMSDLRLKQPECCLTNISPNTPETSVPSVLSTTEARCIKSEKSSSTCVRKKKNKNAVPRKSKSSLSLEECDLADKMTGLRMCKSEDVIDGQTNDLVADCEGRMPGEITGSSLPLEDAAASAKTSAEDNLTVTHTGATCISSTLAAGAVGQSTNETSVISCSVITGATQYSSIDTTRVTPHPSSHITEFTSLPTSALTVDLLHLSSTESSGASPSSSVAVMAATTISTDTVVEVHKLLESTIVPTGTTTEPSSTAILSPNSLETDSPEPVMSEPLLDSQNEDSGSWSLPISTSSVSDVSSPDTPSSNVTSPSVEASDLSQPPSMVRDILLLNANDDEEDAVAYKTHLETEAGLPQDLTVDLFSGIDPGQSDMTSMSSVPRRYRLVLVYLTRNLLKSRHTDYLYEMVLKHKLMQNKNTLPVPVCITKTLDIDHSKYLVTKPLKYYMFLNENPQLKQLYLDSVGNLVAVARQNM